MDTATLDLSNLTPEEARWLTSPEGFAIGFLGLPVYREKGDKVLERCVGKDSRLFYEVRADDWQSRLLGNVSKHGSRTTALTCNGAGKTSVCLAALIFWHLAVFPNSKVVSTSGAWRQLQSQLAPTIKALLPRFPDWEFTDSNFTLRSPLGSEYLGFSTNDEGKAEGYHGNKAEDYLAPSKGPLMTVIDEAKTVPVGIFQAFDRCTYQRQVLLSSAGWAEGPFYESHKSSSIFEKFVVPAAVCPHADHKKNSEIIEKWGLDHPFVKSTIFAQFMSSAENAVFDGKAVEHAMSGKIRHDSGRRVAGLDFAAGGDENVLAIAEGNKVRIVKAWAERDTMKGCAEFVALLKAEGMKPEDCWGDDEGIGRPMMDAMATLGWKIRRHRNGEAARRDAYFNAGAEMWGEAAAAIARGNLILPADSDLAHQLTARKWLTGKATLQLESKDELRRRGVSSPDRADAVLMALYHRVSTPAKAPNFDPGQWDNDTANRVDALASLGLCVGV